MNTDRERELNAITSSIIGCAYHVGRVLGPGFLERVYENALVHELRKAGHRVEQQKNIQVVYDGIVVGDYSADLIVDGAALVELKAIKAFDDVHFAQCLNYLKVTSLKVCLLINFGVARVEIKRLVNEF